MAENAKPAVDKDAGAEVEIIENGTDLHTLNQVYLAQDARRVDQVEALKKRLMAGVDQAFGYPVDRTV